MKKTRVEISHIPALVWGEKSDKVYLCVHGKMSSKESVEGIARIAERRGYQTISFDLPGHGERQNEDERCDIWNGIHDLAVIRDYVFANWKEVSLYACSLGAYFCLNAYNTCNIKKCLFQSPIDMMTWDYYQYVKEHPIQKWDISTKILFAGKDTFQTLEVMEGFDLWSLRELAGEI